MALGVLVGSDMLTRLLTLAALLLASRPSSARAETIYVDDPLSAVPKGAAGVVVGNKGGTFSASGWTTTGDDDALWFLIPATLPSARVEVNVKGVSTSNLDGEEHDLIVTYGDSDRSEPVEYSPAYRNNNFKTNLRIFGAASAAAGGRPQGANKLELRLCPAGLPGYTDTSCPCSTDVFEVGYLGGPPNAIPWDPATTYRFKISWTPGNIRYTRGVEPDVSIGYPGTLAPKALRVRIGSPRHGVGSVNRMPKGITFANLLIAGTPGTPTPACTAADAGVDAPATCDPTKPMRVDPLVMSGDIARVTYRHCAGASSFRIAQFFIGDVVDPVVPNLAGGYEGGRLFVGSDSCAPGEAKKLVSAHGSLDCARTKVVAEGDKLTIDWAVSLDPLGLGIMPRPMFADAKGTGTPEPRLGWTRVGTYDVATTSDAAVVVEETGVGTDAGGDAKRPAMQDEDLGGGELACGCVAGRRTPPNASLTWLFIGLAAALRASRIPGSKCVAPSSI